MIVDLLLLADRLATIDGRRPRQSSLRRAVSCAYYAVFHSLARMCADEFIGATKRNSHAWVRVYRALDHGFAKNAFKSSEVLLLDREIKDFADTFVVLQEQRHVADYDPRPFPHQRKATQAYIANARNAVDNLDAVDAEVKRTLATYVLLRPR